MATTLNQSIKRLVRRPGDVEVATVIGVDVMSTDADGNVISVSPSITVNMHGIGGLKRVELSAGIDPTKINVGDEIMVSQVKDRFIGVALMPLSNRTAAGGQSFGQIAYSTLPTPQIVVQQIGTHIELSWTPVPGATHYEIWQSDTQDTASDNAQLLTTTAATTWSSQGNGTFFNDSLYYSVRAVGDQDGYRASAAGMLSTFTQPSVTPNYAAGIISKNQITAFGGSVILAKASGLTHADFTSVDNTAFTIDVNDSIGVHPTTAPFAVNDILRAHDNQGNILWLKVTATTDQGSFWRYTVTKQNPGAKTNYTITSGSQIVNFGASGQGFILMTADQTNAPYYSVQTHAGSPWSATTELLRLGNLKGWGDYASVIYGLAVGQYGANLPNITIDPTNGLRIRQQNTTFLSFDTSGNAFITGKVQLSGASAALAIGTTPPTSSSAGTGFWLDRTGLYALQSGVQEYYLNAANGNITFNSPNADVGTSLIQWIAQGTTTKVADFSTDFSSTRTQTEFSIEVFGESATNHFAQLNESVTDQNGTNLCAVNFSSKGTWTLDLRSGSNTGVSTQAIDLIIRSLTNNAGYSMLYLDARADSTITPTTGFGGAIAFRVDDNTRTIQNAGFITTYWTTATQASRASEMDFGIYNIAVATTVFGISTSGAAVKSGGLAMNSLKITGLANGTAASDGCALGQPFMELGFNVNGTFGASTTQYIPVITPNSLVSTSNTLVNTSIMTTAGVLRNLYVRLSGTQSATGSIVFTVMQNNVATNIVVTFAAGATTATGIDSSHSVTVAAGDGIAIRVQNNATATSATIGSVTLEFDIV